MRYGIDHSRRGDDVALGRLYRASAVVDGAGGVVGLAIGASILCTMRGTFGLQEALLRDTAILVGARMLTIRSTPLGILRQTDRYRTAAVAEAVTPIVRLIGTAAAATWLPTMNAFLLIWALAEVATAAAFWTALIRSGELRAMRKARLGWRRLLIENDGIVRLLVNSNFSSTLMLGTKQLPLLLVGGVAGPAAAGAFRIAVQLAQGLTKLAQLVARAIFPELVRASRDGRSGPVPRGIWRLAALTGAPAVLVLPLLLLMGERALVLIGGDGAYADGYRVLVWLAGAGAIDLAVVALEPMLLAADRSNAATSARCAGVVLQLALMYVLLPRIGAEGSAIAVLAGSAASALGLALAVRRYLTSHR